MPATLKFSLDKVIVRFKQKETIVLGTIIDYRSGSPVFYEWEADIDSEPRIILKIMDVNKVDVTGKMTTIKRKLEDFIGESVAIN